MKSSSLRWCVTGIIAALMTGAGLWLLPSRYALDSYAMLLALIAGISLGAALSQHDRRLLAREAVAAGACGMLALLGRWVSPHFLVLGYLAHGVWDVLHGMRIIGPPPKTWWPPFCLCYDWILAAAIYARWVR